MKDKNEAMERITAYLDSQLSAEERLQVEQELRDDPSMQRQHDLENGVRTLLHSRRETLRSAVPVHLERRIRMDLGKEVSNAVSESEAPSWISRLLLMFRSPAFGLTAALGIVAVVVVITAQGPPAGQMPEGVVQVDLYETSYSNFSKVVRGEITLVKQSSDQDELNAFFRSEGVDYEVFYPEMEAKLLGGVVSTHGTKHYAHLVYGAGEHIVYIFEVDEGSVQSNCVKLNSLVAEDLDKSKWHWEERSDVGTMFVWKSNNVICSAVSDLRTPEFSSLFTLDKL